MLTMEMAHRAPRRVPLVASLVYGAAAVDAVSRVYRDTHWASDVAASAVVGTLSGLLVTRHQHANPDNRVDRLARRVLFMPIPAVAGGPGIGASVSF